jgi:hypothetical protein
MSKPSISFYHAWIVSYRYRLQFEQTNSNGGSFKDAKYVDIHELAQACATTYDTLF